MERVKSKDGTLIAYERSGAGQPLVLVHGTGGDHTRWATVLPMLERRFTVYTVNRRGRGGSGDAADYAIEREYEDIAAVVGSIAEPANLLGHSYGALCSLEAALLTGNVRRLVLYEPAMSTGIPMYPRGAREKLEALAAAGQREELLATFLREVVELPEDHIKLLRAEPAWQGRLAAAHTIPREFADGDYVLAPERFSGLNTPTMLLMGGDSPAYFRRAAENVFYALPDCRIVKMPGQQHLAMSTAPELFCREAVHFLSG